MTKSCKKKNTKNIIVLVLTNMPDLIKKLSVVDGIADHSTVITDVTISLAKKSSLETNVTVLASRNV